MKKLLNVVWIAALVCLTLTGCAAKDPVITQEMNGQSITLKPGASFTVQLEGNPSTGFNWEASEFDSTVIQQTGEAGFKAESDLVGAPGTVTLKFEALAKGETSLKLVYHRSWEKDVAPESVFEIKIKVE